MFTGIVRHVGSVRGVRPASHGSGLTIDLGPLAKGLAVGDSVAVSGACLTASGIRETEVDFDVVAETLSHTTLGAIRVGSKVNLERSLTLSAALDGHLVQGHVDGIAEVSSVSQREGWKIEFAAPPELIGQMVPKGSITVDGVSLTLADVAKDTFSVAIIPTTGAETTLGELSVGAKVNVETDIIGKYVLKHLRQLSEQGTSGGLTLDKLKDSGFLDR